MDTVSNHNLQLAFDFVKFTNRNIFLTGKAGTGKTTFLHELKKSLPKRMVVMAPTGVAAINAGGVTIHSFFQLPFHPFIPALYLPGKKPESSDGQGSYKMSREKINIIRSLDLLVIDEISMVRADLLDAIDSWLRRYKNHDLPFGGVQLLMIGDLQQLAPVVKDEDKEILSKYYDIYYFFGSQALRRTDYVTIELKHIYRQNDQVFISLLNKVRENKVDSEVLDELNKRYIPDFDAESNGGYITLTTHNNQAAALNESKLEKLAGKPHTFKASVRDDFPELSYPNVNELVLKKGAQVMFVKNDISRDKLFFNGKIGKVEAFMDDVILVKCPGDDFTISVEMAEWQNVKYTLNDETKDIEEKVIGTFTQYPLKLAWAITIHKSQGLTFDRAVIDARSAFAHGQVYVALSRCRSLNGLVLSSRIDQRCIIDNPSVSGFIRETEQNQPGQKELMESRRVYQQQLLTALFDFTSVIHNLSYCRKVIEDNNSSILGNPHEKFETAMSVIRTDVIEVSDKFQQVLIKLFKMEADAEENTILQERVQKAGEFFSLKLEAALRGIVTGFTIETDNKSVRKSFNEALERLRKESAAKLSCLKAVTSGFKVSEFLDAKAKAAIEAPAIKSNSSRFADEASDTILHPALFRLLKEWRNKKADDLNLPVYMILPQKTMNSLANQVPHSMHAIKLVKGMGKKKSEKFGPELLEIIRQFCEKEKIEKPAEPDQTLDEEKTRKKIKPDTKKITLDLFRNGKAISEIAFERNLSTTTIESHLAHYVGTGDIPIIQFMPKEKSDMIAGHFDGSDELRLGPVKEILGDQVSWSELRFVMNHILFMRKSRS